METTTEVHTLEIKVITNKVKNREGSVNAPDWCVAWAFANGQQIAQVQAGERITDEAEALEMLRARLPISPRPISTTPAGTIV